MFIQRQKRRIAAGTDGAGAQVAPEATDILFEAEDVAELVAEVTGEPVEVTVDTDQVVFAVGEDEYTVEAEGDEEVLEACHRVMRGKKPVSASTKRSVAASRNSRSVRKIPASRTRR